MVKPPPGAGRGGEDPSYAPRTLQRTLSLGAGEELVEAVHTELQQSTLRIEDDGGVASNVGSTTSRWCDGPMTLGDICHGSFNLGAVLASLSTDEHRDRFLQDITDPCPTRALERSGAINWHPDKRRCSRLVALRTESDGNCLNHAASLACFGVHDRRLLLRAAVRSFLVESESETGCRGQRGATPSSRMVRAIRKAWEHELSRYGVELDRESFDLEWKELQKQCSLECRLVGDRPMYAYLEASHVYILAHVLRRPIIVFASDWTDSRGRKLAAAEEIAGVYLPFELPRDFCSRTPIVLAFDAFHFSPLLPTDNRPHTYVPLCTRSGRLLPLPFFKRDGNVRLQEAVLNFWLDCERLPDGTLAARLESSPPPADGVSRLLLECIVNSVRESEPPSPPRHRRSSSCVDLKAANQWNDETAARWIKAQRVAAEARKDQEDADFALALQLALDETEAVCGPPPHPPALRASRTSAAPSRFRMPRIMSLSSMG